MSRHGTAAGGRRVQGAARRLTVIVAESDMVGHRPLYTELVHRAHAAGLAGATVLRGIEGFGASQQIHTSRLLSLSEDLPVSVILVDTAERIDAFLPELQALVDDGLILLDDVQVVVPGGTPPG